MALLAPPRELSAMDDGSDLEFAQLGIPHPPSELGAHAVSKRATSAPGWKACPFASTWRTRRRPGEISRTMAPNGRQKEPVLTTTTPEAVRQTPGRWVWPIAMKRALGRWRRARAAARPGASRQARR